MRKMLFMLAAQAVAAGGLTAQSPRSLVAPIVPCPPVIATPVVPCPPGVPATPVVPYVPGAPGTPNTPPGTPDGSAVPPVVPPIPGGSSDADTAFARQSEGGTQAAQSYSPNMFGDQFGARALRIQLRANLRANMPTRPSTLAGYRTAYPLGLYTFDTGGVATLVQDSRYSFEPQSAGAGEFRSITGAELLNTEQGRGNENVNFQQPIPVSQADLNTVRTLLNELLSTRQLTLDQINRLPIDEQAKAEVRANRERFNRFLTAGQLTPEQINDLPVGEDVKAELRANRTQINNLITQTTRGVTFTTASVGQISATFSGLNTPGESIEYLVPLLAETILATPGGGSTVGRVKASENNSPVPRDRIIFVYDYFDNVPLTSRGVNVNRFQFGVEKTFRDGLWSVEFRLPFAGTLSNSNVQGFETKDVEFGNVRFALKRMLTNNPRLNLSTGMALTLPTAEDTVLNSIDGSELLRYRNESVTLEPYLAALWTPNERLFSQTWASVNFDASGGVLSYNRLAFGGSGSARIFDLPILALDSQVGYWLVDPGTNGGNGWAPFLELHYNHAIGDDAFVRAANDGASSSGLAISSIGSDELNMTAGMIGQRGNLNYSLGVAFPLLRSPDRTFDWQVGVRASYLYGRSARTRNPIYSVNTF